jgi:hypothetical protein
VALPLFLKDNRHMNSYEVHFTVRGILTTFAEAIDAEEVNEDTFRVILNERLKTEGFNSTVDEIFLVIER